MECTLGLFFTSESNTFQLTAKAAKLSISELMMEHWWGCEHKSDPWLLRAVARMSIFSTFTCAVHMSVEKWLLCNLYWFYLYVRMKWHKICFKKERKKKIWVFCFTFLLSQLYIFSQINTQSPFHSFHSFSCTHPMSLLHSVISPSLRVLLKRTE